jgi:glycosyltransferase involved in cell wall biosynthesis
MARALGDYIAFLDADDVWLPTKLEDQINLFKKHNDLGIVSCNFKYMNQLGEDKSPFNMRRLYPKDGFNLYNLLRHSSLIPSSVMITKKVVDAVGFFKSDYDGAEDIEYYLRVLTKYHLGLVDEVLLKYRIGHPSFSKGDRPYQVREKVFDDFFKGIPNSSSINLSLAKTDAYYGLYYNHGKDLLQKGRIREARQYFMKALYYKKTSNILCLYLKSYLKEWLMFFGLFKNSDRQ